MSTWSFWERLALVASIVWVGVIEIISVNSRDFQWFLSSYRNDYSLGPAAITAVVGAGLIWVVCLAFPHLGRKD
jgi:hypothetical protein